MPWEPVILQPFEGEKLLFKIGLMTFKAPSSKTDGQFAFIETELPPGAAVERHQHREAEMFYIVSGAFDFWVGEMASPVRCLAGAFLCVPPDVPHAFANADDHRGRIFGMLAPATEGGLESFFRAVSIPIRDASEVPDLDQPVEHMQEIIRQRRASRF